MRTPHRFPVLAGVLLALTIIAAFELLGFAYRGALL